MTDLFSLTLNPRQLCDIELLLNGGFAPLSGFMGKKDYDSVCKHMRLDSGELWPMPITLDIDDKTADQVIEGAEIALCDREGITIAVLLVQSKWIPDKVFEAISIYGTQDTLHPGVDYLLHQTGSYYIGGKLRKIQLPIHYDFVQYRYTPESLKELFIQNGWKNIVAFQTRNPLHRAHFELMCQAMQDEGANLLLQPVVGMTKPGDINYHTRTRCYEKIIHHFPPSSAMLSLLPLAMRMAGPKEALWHAIIRKNYGATSFIVGRDHAGPGNNVNGNPFYDPYEAQKLTNKYAAEIGIKIITFNEFVYVENQDKYLPLDKVIPEDKVLNISGTEFRRMLRHNIDIPAWFSYPEIIGELKKSFPPKHKQGLTVFFTGLSGAGKSTIANALMIKLLESVDRPITLLDGDLVRKNLSSELGFSKEHRDINILRIGYVASEITKHRGIAICAPIAPYTTTRRTVRTQVEEHGSFIEVYISTPIDICEKRDRKGLYKKARLGLIKDFTGIDDPYEVPINPEITINTAKYDVHEAVNKIMLKLMELGCIRPFS